MNETLRTKIQGGIKEVCAEANSDALLKGTGRVVAADLAIAAERQVRTMRDRTGMTWEQAWAEIAPEILGTLQPSVSEKALETS